MSKNWLDIELEELELRGLVRELREIYTPQGTVLDIDGKEVANFCSNDYLDLASDKRLVAAVKAAADRWGAGAGSSRLIAGNIAIYSELEEELAALKGKERALLFPSGYHANLGLITSVVGKIDAVLSDRFNHASIIDGCRLSGARIRVFDHNDPEHLDHLLAKEKDSRKTLVVTESLFSMEGDIAPLPDIVAVAKKHSAMIAIDDAHATGVLGKNGGGGLEHFGVDPAEVDAVIGTLGKALGSSGAFVAASEKLVSFLVNRARTFIFTTGPFPAASAAAKEALRIVRDEPWRRERVIEIADRTRKAVKDKGLETKSAEGSPILPIVVGSADKAMEACNALLQKGIFVQGIRPPSVPAGASRLRITFSAGHTDEQIDRLIKGLLEVLSS